MREVTIHCVARDADVRVLLTDEPLHDGQAPLADADRICLEIDDRCGGEVCPLGAGAPVEMDAALVKLGLDAGHGAVRALCGGCDRVTEMHRVVGGYVVCTECGTTMPAPGAA